MILQERINEILHKHKVDYQVLEHSDAPTCEMAALLRGTEVELGLKTLMFKSKKSFHLFSLRAHLQIDSKKVRKILGSQRLRFATEEELYKFAGAKRGALPPFGRELFEMDLYLDESIYLRDEVAFNAGVLHTSYILKREDYLKVVQPRFENFSIK